VKVGEIFAMLDGMRIDTKLLLTNSNRNVARFVLNTEIAKFFYVQLLIYCFRVNGEAAAAAAAGESSSADHDSRVANGTAASNNNPSGGDVAGGARPRTRSNDVEAVIPAASRTPNGTPQSSSRTPNGTPATGATAAAAAAPLPVPAGDPAAASAQVAPLPEEPLPPGYFLFSLQVLLESVKIDSLCVFKLGGSLRQVQSALLCRSQHAQYDVGATATSSRWMGDEEGSARPRLLRRPQYTIVMIH